MEEEKEVMESENWRIERLEYGSNNLYYKDKLIAENLTESDINDLVILGDSMRNPWAL